MNLTNEQIERILAGAPDEATHFQHGYGTYYKICSVKQLAYAWIRKDWFAYPIYPNLSGLDDLREILKLRQKIDRLEGERGELLSTGYYDGYMACGESVGGLAERACFYLEGKSNKYAEDKLRENQSE